MVFEELEHFQPYLFQDDMAGYIAGGRKKPKSKTLIECNTKFILVELRKASSANGRGSGRGAHPAPSRRASTCRRRLQN